MNENLDLKKILKDCPRGIKLYSKSLGTVKFDGIDNINNYILVKGYNDKIALYKKNGVFFCAEADAEIDLLPSKDQRDWSKWQRPFVDGDIIFTYIKGGIYDSKWLSIFRRTIDNRCETYVDMNISDRDFYINDDESKYFCNLSNIKYQRFATDEEKKLLFDTVRKRGYRWNAETKMMKKLPKDRFDPKTLKPFDKALVRIDSDDNWYAVFFSHIEDINGEKFVTTAGMCYKQMIPYNENTKHLLGTNNEAPEYYKCWEE